MNNSKKLCGGSLIAAILCMSFQLLANRPTPELRQKIQKLETIKGKLAVVNRSPVLTRTTNSSDKMTIQDIQNIKDDLEIIKNTLQVLIETQLEAAASNL